ncbi:VOC family protein [Lysinibacillus fusiformis]|uniref:VOC family protein n=1 Tax=Lysinibacillus fusiformis TaxID=28031 RepID=UPI00215AEAD4|nr:VOC family protein [Lysinibacillus fusiformis]MCR8853056.1 VOC family protein [Lysinibacillus fusiformis]WKT75437.1 VOC family protein [Lysinibacillus fusiformis]
MKITRVKLVVHDVQKMQHFYCEQMGFALVKGTEDYFTIAVGESEMTFEKVSSHIQKQYHFALNIPCNLFQQAKDWANERVGLLFSEGQDEVYFQFLKAYSCYFYDPEGNIVEFISRQEVNQKLHTTTFSIDQVLHVGEINLTTDDILAVARELNEYGIKPINNNNIQQESLNFLGNYEDGANILVGPSDRPWYFSDKIAQVSPICIEINGTLQLIMDEKGHLTVQ